MSMQYDAGNIKVFVVIYGIYSFNNLNKGSHRVGYADSLKNCHIAINGDFLRRHQILEGL